MKKVYFWVAFSLVMVSFFVAFSLVSIVPHMNFNTKALDLGMFNHALYCYAHLMPNHFTLDFTGAEIPYMGDHFSPITMLYAPFYYIFGTYTLLIIQIAAILFGGYGIFVYARYKGIGQWLSLFLMIQFFLIWGVYSALTFDFHNNVIAAMLIPWFVYAYDKGNLKLTLLFFVLVLISKENMALWMAFIILALLIRKEQPLESVSKRYGIIMMVFAAIFFVVAVQVIMPAYAHGQGTNQLRRYGHLGGSLSEMVVTLFDRPDVYFSMLFENTLDIPGGLGIKSKLLFMVLVSGGFAMFRKPHFLVMLIPVFAQKMLSSSFTIWGIHHQYSIEFVPVISLAIIALVCSIKSPKWAWLLVLALIFTSYHFNKENIKIFDKEHYQVGFDVKAVAEAIKVIPEDAIVTVNSELAPHLAFRKKIYHFPVIKDAEYVALLKKSGTYPLRRAEFDNKIELLRADPSSRILYDSPDIIIVKIRLNQMDDLIIKPIDVVMDREIKEIEQGIRNSKEWFKIIEEKAVKNNISVDSMLRNDATWVYQNRKRK